MVILLPETERTVAISVGKVENIFLYKYPEHTKLDYWI